MAVFSANRAAFTPSLTTDNWLLWVSANQGGLSVVGIGWGGRGSSSTAYATRWTRPTTFDNTGTNLSKERHSPGVAGSGITITHSQITPSTLTSGDLFSVNWDVHGGNGQLFLPVNDGWMLSGSLGTAEAISCRNTQGTDANLSNYWVMWEE